jgi:hypothetical protein
MGKRLIFIFALILLSILSCCDSQTTRTKRLLKEWIGKEILFPQEARFTVLGNDVNVPLLSESHKILAYHDTEGCMECKLELHYWMQFMRDVQDKSRKKVSLMFVLDTTKENRDRIDSIMRLSQFDYPVWFDSDALFVETNKFPRERAFHFFLLDEDNRVVLIGNPISKSQIWDKYIEMLMTETLH